MRVPRNLLLSTWLLSPLASLASAGAGQCTGIIGQLASAVVGEPIARSFCSSRYPQPAQTVTLSQNASAATSTITITTVGVPITITVNGTATTLITTDATTTVIASVETDKFTNTSTETDFTTSTTTYLSTYTFTNTSTATITPKKRDLISNKLRLPTFVPISTKNPTTTTAKIPTGMVPGRASVPAVSTLFSVATSVASAICKCIETPRTSTITLRATATTVTITSTVTSTPTSIATATPTAISDLTATVLTTSTTDTTSETTTTTITTDIITTSTIDTTTVSVTTTTTLPTCNKYAASFQEKAGCISGCYCNVDSEGVAFCDDDTGSRKICNTSANCPNNEVCDIGDLSNSSGVGYCVTNPATNSCGGIASKRSLFGRGTRMGRMRLKSRGTRIVNGKPWVEISTDDTIGL